MKRLFLHILILCLPACQVAFAEARLVDEFTWENVDRIIAIGDLHGDYENYIESLELAGLINRRGRWSGGTTHLVQTGDIADRGPDTRKIIAHIDKLARQAEKDGGRVHMLIGNHEAMNIYGDLRYVTPEEFADFADRGSEKIRDRYYKLVMDNLENNDPEAFANLPENHRELWDSDHPPGFIEHQQAWNPAWNPEGEYFERSLKLKAAIKINGVVFVHAGISEKYAGVPLQELSERMVAQLSNFDESEDEILTDTCGPFWYRGHAGVKPELTSEQLTSILEQMSANRIVAGHTPTPAVIWPRYNGRVLQIDSGISKTYGGYPSYVEFVGDETFAGYRGGKIPIPDTDAERLQYLDAVQELEPENPGIERFRKRLERSANVAAVAPEDGETPAKAEPADVCTVAELSPAD